MPDRFDAAGIYLARMLAGSDTASARRELEAWQNRAPENLDAAGRVFAAWEATGAAGNDPDVLHMLADMRDRYESPGTLRNGSWKGWAVAAGLAMLLSVPTAYWLLHHPGEQPMAAGNVETASAAASRAVDATTSRRTIQLDDGSQITLDVDSAVRIAYSADRRAVTLAKGRAHFKVSKDKHRPFVVTAGRLTATAVGTAFDVRLSPDGEEVMTSEGIVRVVTQFPVGAHGREALVNAGMMLTQMASSVVVRPADAAQETAWTNGKIIASSRCLGEVASEMNQYGKSTLVVGRDVANIAISGVFELDNGEGLAEALEQQELATVRHDGSRILLTKTGGTTIKCRPGN